VVSKHIARFLGQSLQNVKASEKLAALVGPRAGTEALIPTAVLFNGGVFKAPAIRARVLDLLADWNGGQPIRELQGFEPDLAVARGAAIYGRHRATGKGVRIKAGAARSYYIGLETSMPAVPGYKPPLMALCVVPQGMEEGTELLIEGREFGLVTGRVGAARGEALATWLVNHATNIGHVVQGSIRSCAHLQSSAAQSVSAFDQ
jgi:hypothetical protein